MALILLFLFRISAAAPLSPNQICTLALSNDARLDLLAERSPRRPEVRVARAKLMNEAWWPVMAAFRDLVRTLPPEEIRGLARRTAEVLDEQPHQHHGSREERLETARAAGFRFNRAYTSYYASDDREEISAHWLDFNVGATRANRAFVKKVHLAAAVMMRLADDHADRLRAALADDAGHVLQSHSYTGTRLEQTLSLAVETTAQALSWVTAEAVDDVTPEHLARACSTPHRATSTLERLALSLPPRLIGLFGGDLYFSPAVRLGADGRPRLTREIEVFLDDARTRWEATDGKRAFEFGFGCPLAYPAPGDRRDRRTGVGLGLEIFWIIFDSV